MNYRYKIDDLVVVLSEEEDGFVTGEIKKGASVVYLRGDKFAINVNFIRYRKETSELTPEQEERRYEQRSLPAETETAAASRRRSVGEMLRATHEEMYARMGWEHGPDCVCKRPDFIKNKK